MLLQCNSEAHLICSFFYAFVFLQHIIHSVYMKIVVFHRASVSDWNTVGGIMGLCLFPSNAKVIKLSLCF